MNLKIRTIYFKSQNIAQLRIFYSKLFKITPKINKDTEEWVEFDFGNINFALILILDEKYGKSNCVPVFECKNEEVSNLKQKVTDLGGKVLMVDYDGFNSALCIDPEGNEFEITTFHN